MQPHLFSKHLQKPKALKQEAAGLHLKNQSMALPTNSDGKVLPSVSCVRGLRLLCREKLTLKRYRSFRTERSVLDFSDMESRQGH